MVGPDQDRPVLGRDRRWSFGVVVGREIDSDLLGSHSQQLLGAEFAVIQVHRSPTTDSDTEFGEGGDERPPDRGELGVSFADVMEQCRPDQICPIQMSLGTNPLSSVVTMPLVGSILSKEDVSLSAEKPPYPGPLAGREFDGEDDAEESRDQVSPRPYGVPPRKRASICSRCRGWPRAAPRGGPRRCRARSSHRCHICRCRFWPGHRSPRRADA